MPLVTLECFVHNCGQCSGLLPPASEESLAFDCGCSCHGPRYADNTRWRAMRDADNLARREARAQERGHRRRV